MTMHVCRGNFRSTWISSGGYEPVAETLLGGVNMDGYFLEYDTDRAGGFEPLRFLPKGPKIVVLGLITSKAVRSRKKDDIKRRIDEAARVRPARTVRPLPAVRLCVDRGRQRADRRGAVGEDANDPRNHQGSVGLTVARLSSCQSTRGTPPLLGCACPGSCPSAGGDGRRSRYRPTRPPGHIRERRCRPDHPRRR